MQVKFNYKVRIKYGFGEDSVEIHSTHFGTNEMIASSIEDCLCRDGVKAAEIEKNSATLVILEEDETEIFKVSVPISLGELCSVTSFDGDETQKPMVIRKTSI